MKFVSKKAQNSNIVVVILNSIQQPSRVVVTSFRLRSLIQMFFEESLNYQSGFWLFSSSIILSQTFSKLRNDSIEDSEVGNRLEKIDFTD